MTSLQLLVELVHHAADTASSPMELCAQDVRAARPLCVTFPPGTSHQEVHMTVDVPVAAVKGAAAAMEVAADGTVPPESMSEPPHVVSSVHVWVQAQNTTVPGGPGARVCGASTFVAVDTSFPAAGTLLFPSLPP